MSNAVRRTIFRWVHIAFGVPIVGYVYSPFEELHHFAAVVRYFFLPVLVFSGVWLWKGHLLLRPVRKRAGWRDVARPAVVTARPGPG